MKRYLILLLLLITTQGWADSGSFTYWDSADIFGGGSYRLPGASSQTFFAGYDSTVDGSLGQVGTFTRASSAWNPETLAVSTTNNPVFTVGRNNLAAGSVFIQETSTNVFLNSSSTSIPSTQTIALTTANSGKWTCSVTGPGIVVSSAGTATATGYGVATEGVPITLTVTGNGTVVFTVYEALSTTRVQVENLPHPTAFIETAGSPVTRAVDVLNYSATNVLSTEGTIELLVKIDTSKVAKATSQFSFFDTHTSGSANRITFFKNATANQYELYTTNAASAVTSTAATVVLTNDLHQFNVTWGGTTNPQVFIDGTLRVTGTNNNIPVTIGTTLNIASNYLNQSQLGMSIDQISVFNRALTSEEILKRYNAQQRQIPPPSQIIFDGNSLVAGTGASAGHNMPTLVTSALISSGKYSTLQNFGVSSQTTVQMTSDAQAQIDSLYNLSKYRNIVVVWEGTNDIYFGATAEEAYNNLVSYCQARRSAGYKVVIVTLLPRSNAGTPVGFDTDRLSVNTNIRNNWTTFADAIADVASNTAIGDAGDELDTIYYNSDKVHMTDTGYGVVAGAVKAAIMGLM